MSKAVRARALVIVLVVVLTVVAWGSSLATAQEPTSDLLWVDQFGTPYDDWASDVAVDATSVYVAGVVYEGHYDETNQTCCAFVSKYDLSGNVLWTRHFNVSRSSSEAEAVAVDASGVYVGGFTDTYGESNVTRDAFLRKYDPNGNVLWTSLFGTNFTVVLAAAVDPSGVYVAGVTGGLPGQTRAGQGDAFLRKYDANGNVLWTSQFGTADFDIASGVAIDTSGVYVAGSSSVSDWTSQCSVDAFLRKYDAAGNVSWIRKVGTSKDDCPRAVAVGASGVYVLAGSSLWKYDAAGNAGWTHKFGSSPSDFPQAVAAVATGAYVAGVTPGNLTASPLDATDILLESYDAVGNVTGTRKFGTSDWESPLAVAADANRVFVGGFTWGTLQGEASGGKDDAFIAALPALLAGGPALSLTAPVDGTTVQEGTVFVAGTTEADAHLVVNGLVVAVSPSGSFSLNLALKEGTNVITATATNSTGYSTTIYRTVTYVNPLPSLEQELQETRDQLDAAYASLAALGTQVVVGFVAIAGILSTLQYLLFRRLRRPGGAKLAHGSSETAGPPDVMSVPGPLQPPPSIEGSNSRPTRRVQAGQLPNRAIRLTTKERILLHLARYARPTEAAEAPPALTQEGVAAATWIEPRHLAQYVDPLVRDGLVGVRSAHVRNGSQRRRVYELTEAGRRVATRLLARAKSEVVPVWDGEHIWEVRMGDIMEKMNHKLSVLDLARHLAEAGVVDFAALGVGREDTSAEAGDSDLEDPSDATTGEG